MNFTHVEHKVLVGRKLENPENWSGATPSPYVSPTYQKDFFREIKFSAKSRDRGRN